MVLGQIFKEVKIYLTVRFGLARFRIDNHPDLMELIAAFLFNCISESIIKW